MEKGIYLDNRNRKISVICTDVPGAYPVIGVQLTKSGKAIAKDGLRAYTADGKIYKNGGRTVDALDLRSTKVSDLTVCNDCECEPETVTLVFKLNDREVGREEVEVDSDDYEELTANGWEEVA